MRFCVVAVACIGAALTAGASQAACNKPQAPACAIERAPFPTDKDADDCRKDMLKFRDAMGVYAACLGETSKDEEKAANDEYEDVRAQFNRRARGE